MNRAISAAFLLVSSACVAETGFVEEALIGHYILVGKAVDSDHTYVGKVEVFATDGGLAVTRTINGTAAEGTAAVETALNGDAEVLRIRFAEAGVPFEETCLFRADLDNHARISCYLYRPGVRTENPGLEVFFHDRTAE